MSAEQAVTDEFTNPVRTTPVTAADVLRPAIPGGGLRRAMKFDEVSWPHDKLTGESLHLYQRSYSLPAFQCVK